MGFTITTEREAGFTQISNLFLHNYMPMANGNFVKIYLYLQMASQHPEDAGELSVSGLADQMECTENDIIRSLHYWQREGLIDLQEENGDIRRISLRELSQKTVSAHTASAVTAQEISAAEEPRQDKSPDKTADLSKTSEVSIPDKQTYTPLQAEALVKDVEINCTINAVEQLLGSPVSPAHLQTILYFMCDIGFSSELLVTLYETAVRKGKKQPQYIEAIGISWARKGITTPEEAREEAASFSGRYALVSRALGITRGLAPAERSIIDSWNPYHFADSIIEEACKRTVLQTGDTNLNYVSKILEDWHKKQVISLQDVEKCDESYKKQRRNHSEKKKSVSQKNQFQNFPQRTYSQDDYNNLERQLLQGQKG